MGPCFLWSVYHVAVDTSNGRCLKQSSQIFISSKKKSQTLLEIATLLLDNFLSDMAKVYISELYSFRVV